MTKSWKIAFLLGESISEDQQTAYLFDGKYFELLRSAFKESGLASAALTETSLTEVLLLLSEKELLQVGISSLLAFIQAGWTGPALEWTSQDIFPIASNFDANTWNKTWLKKLVVDEEDPYSLTPEPFLLWLAEFIFTTPSLESKIDGNTLGDWWKFRCAFTHQKLIDNQSASLQDYMFKYLATVKSEILQYGSPTLSASFYLEEGLMYQWYGNDTKAKECFNQAQLATGLVWEATGVLGKRTKFQQFETSQLAIMATSSLSVQDEDTTKEPKMLDLNDDTLLEKIEYTGQDMDQKQLLKGNLNPIDQAILLAFCLNVKNTNPADGLTTEEMFPYVSRVLENPNNWMITTMGLLLKSRLESNKSRTVERSCLQLQTLVDQWKLQDNDASVADRMKFIHILLVPSKWEMEQELGLIFVSLGVVRSALEIFERLELWDNVISCHQMLEQPKKAEEVILEQLSKNPESPKLYCLLGDVKSDFTYYEKAWDLSGRKYSRAMRSLGAHYFSVKQYSKCIECYENALAINPLFENSWFVMGCSALQIEDYETSIHAFSRCTSIDPQNFEAWNNQASAFIKQKKLVEAFRCLKESIRINYEASNIWENYLFVAIDLKEMSEAIRAVERVFMIRIQKEELKSQAVDEQILEIIATSIVNDIPDANGRPCSLLASKFEKLLLQILSKTASAKLYAIASVLFRWKGDYIQMIEYSAKTYRLLLHDPTLSESKIVFEGLVEATLELVKVYVEGTKLKQVPRMGEEEVIVCPDGLYQAKMALKAVIGRSKSAYSDSEDFQRLVDTLEEVKGIRL